MSGGLLRLRAGGELGGGDGDAAPQKPDKARGKIAHYEQQKENEKRIARRKDELLTPMIAQERVNEPHGGGFTAEAVKHGGNKAADAGREQHEHTREKQRAVEIIISQPVERVNVHKRAKADERTEYQKGRGFAAMSFDEGEHVEAREKTAQGIRRQSVSAEEKKAQKTLSYSLDMSGVFIRGLRT